jgi:flagellin
MVTFNRNILGLGVARQINQQSNQLRRVFEQLSSGNRISSFDVDAAGGAIATRLEAAFRGVAAMNTEDQTRVNRMQTEEGAMGNIQTQLQEIRELQAQAGSDILAPEDVQAIQDEIDQRVENIRGIVDNTQFAGNNLIAPGEEIAAVLENGISATGDIGSTDAAIEEVSAERSEIGADINAVQSRIAERETTFENTLAGFSRIADMNMATGVSEQVNSQVLQLAAVNSLRNLFVFNRQNALSLLNNI